MKMKKLWLTFFLFIFLMILLLIFVGLSRTAFFSYLLKQESQNLNEKTSKWYFIGNVSIETGKILEMYFHTSK